MPLKILGRKMANFELAVKKTLIREGGGKVTNISGDAGGLTKYGISQRSYPNLDIANLTEQQAIDIYRRDFWKTCGGDFISSQAVAESYFDFACNAGEDVATAMVQKIVGAAVDGDCGPQTIKAINSIDPGLFLLKFKLAKIERYAAICNKNRSQDKFLLGWINRTLEA